MERWKRYRGIGRPVAASVLALALVLSLFSGAAYGAGDAYGGASGAVPGGAEEARDVSGALSEATGREPDGAADAAAAAAALGQEIEDKTVEPRAGQEYEGYIVVADEDGGAPLEEMAEAAEDAGYEASVSGRYVLVDEPTDALDFADVADIESIVPNFTISTAAFPQDVPNDPLFPTSQQNYWPFETDVPDVATAYGIGARGVYVRGLSGAGIKVGIFDTGLSYKGNPDLRKDFTTNGLNFASMASGAASGPVDDQNGHGTAVAGFIAARVNNGYGVAGLTDGAEIYPYRVFNGNTGSFNTLLFGLDYLDRKGQLPDVINMSLGADIGSVYTAKVLGKTFDAVAAKGVIVVAAAGNNAAGKIGERDPYSYPASFDSVISVANSVAGTGELHYTSYENDRVDVTAPGSYLYSLKTDGKAGYVGTGTSFASPQVAGVAVAAKQLANQKGLWLDAYSLRSLIKETSRKIHKGGFDYDAKGHSDSYGYGLLDAEALLAYLEQPGLYSIKYNLDGGRVERPCVPVSYVTEGALESGVVLPGADAVKKDGYVLRGWRLDGEGPAKSALTKDATPTSGAVIALTADWGKDQERDLKASDFSVSYDVARTIDEEMEKSGDGRHSYETGVASYASLANVVTGRGDKVIDVVVGSDFWFTQVTAAQAEGVYSVEIHTDKGEMATVAMTVYNPAGGRRAAMASTRYDLNSLDVQVREGASIIASPEGASVALSKAGTADLTSLADAKAFTWSREGAALKGVFKADVATGWLEKVTGAGTYTAWVAPEGHELSCRLTFTVVVTDDTTYTERQDDVEEVEDVAGEADAAKIVSVTANAAPPYAPLGGKVRLSAVVSGDFLSDADKAVKWSVVTQDGSAATIDADTGLFAAGGKEGVATLRVSAANRPSVYDELSLIVANPVTKVSLPFKKLSLKKGASFTVPASAYSAKDGPVKLMWTSSNAKVASVNGVSGRVKALAKGSAVITARSLSGKSAKFTVTVVNKAKKVRKIKVGGYKKTMKRGDMAQLQISVSPADATVQSISIKSGKPSVLSVDRAGKITAKKKGSATITVKAGNTSQKIKIRVK
jgi:hypothetical protein